MSYTIEIDVKNHRYPIQRLIHEIADRVEAGVSYGPIIVNGEKLGSFELRSVQS